MFYTPEAASHCRLRPPVPLVILCRPDPDRRPGPCRPGRRPDPDHRPGPCRLGRRPDFLVPLNYSPFNFERLLGCASDRPQRPVRVPLSCVAPSQRCTWFRQSKDDACESKKNTSRCTDGGVKWESNCRNANRDGLLVRIALHACRPVARHLPAGCASSRDARSRWSFSIVILGRTAVVDGLRARRPPNAWGASLVCRKVASG